jgi:Collagen triple helix repeat (20 copies)
MGCKWLISLEKYFTRTPQTGCMRGPHSGPIPLSQLITDGIVGIDGALGIVGIVGKEGADGMLGMVGIDGADGIDGMDGADGAEGMDGIEGIFSVAGNPDTTLYSNLI